MQRVETRHRGALWLGVALLALGGLPGSSGCNLIAVGMMVGKGFTPGLMKGDMKRLKKHSSHRLNSYWRNFTQKEISAAVSGATGGGKKGKGGKRSKPAPRPSVSLVGFKTKGSRALLVARMGKRLFSFECVKENGSWKVDDLELKLGLKRMQLSRLLKLMVAAKTIQTGLQTGSRYLLVNVSTPRFRRLVLDRIGDGELALLASATKSMGKRGKRRGKKRKKPGRIIPNLQGKRGTVTLAGGALPVRIFMVEKDGQFWVDGLALKLTGKWQQASSLLAYVSPALELLRWGQKHLLVKPSAFRKPDKAALSQLIGRLRGVFTAEAWGRSFGWLRPGDLALLPWATLNKALAAGAKASSKPRRPAARKSPGFSTKAITRFERKGSDLHLSLALAFGKVEVTLRLQKGSWRLHTARLNRDGVSYDFGELLAGAAPLARLAAKVVQLAPAIFEKKRPEALVDLLKAIQATASKDFNQRFWKRISPALLKALPLQALPDSLQDLLKLLAPKGAAAGGDPARAAATTPGFKLLGLTQAKGRLTVAVLVGGRRLRLEMVKEPDGWKFDDLWFPLGGAQRSVKDTLSLFAPAVALGHAFMTGDGQGLLDAADPQLKKTVMAPLLNILGRQFPRLMRGMRKLILPKPGLRKATPPRPASRAAPTKAKAKAKAGSGFRFLGITYSKGGAQADVKFSLGPKAPLSITLTRDAQRIWRIADLSFPLGGRSLSLRRAGPVFVPLLGFVLALVDGNLRGVRKACSYSFNKAVWYKANYKSFQGVVKKFMDLGGKKIKSLMRGRKPPAGRGGRKARRSGKNAPPRLVALRIKDRGRWAWAQVVISIGGRNIRSSLVKQRGRWKVHDVSLKVGPVNLSLKTILGFML